MALLDRLDDDDLPPTPGTAAVSIEPISFATRRDASAASSNEASDIEHGQRRKKE
jgi:hypothetical protein